MKEIHHTHIQQHSNPNIKKHAYKSTYAFTQNIPLLHTITTKLLILSHVLRTMHIAYKCMYTYTHYCLCPQE